MKTIVFFMNILLIILINTAHGIENMSQEERDVREKMDQIQKSLFKCYVLHKVNPMEQMMEQNPSVCVPERKAYLEQGKIFNAFMRQLDKSRRFPKEEFQKQRKEFISKYKTYRLEDLQTLHFENCQTKWGSSDSTECNVISEQSSIKRRKRFKEFEAEFKSYNLEDLEPKHKANCPTDWNKSSLKCKAMAVQIKNFYREKYDPWNLANLTNLHLKNCPEKFFNSSLECQVVQRKIRKKGGPWR
jgi:hypothetical protein